jgi:hypothetical protein
MLNVRVRSQSRFRSPPTPSYRRSTKPKRPRNLPTATLNKLRLIGDTVDASFRLCESSLQLVEETNELVNDIKQMVDSVRAEVYYQMSPTEALHGGDTGHPGLPYTGVVAMVTEHQHPVHLSHTPPGWC